MKLVLAMYAAVRMMPLEQMESDMTNLESNLITKLVTFENAEQYHKETDRWLFVWYLIEAEDVAPDENLVELIEDRLEDVILDGEFTVQRFDNLDYATTQVQNGFEWEVYGRWYKPGHPISQITTLFTGTEDTRSKATTRAKKQLRVSRIHNARP